MSGNNLICNQNTKASRNKYIYKSNQIYNTIDIGCQLERCWVSLACLILTVHESCFWRWCKILKLGLSIVTSLHFCKTNSCFLYRVMPCCGKECLPWAFQTFMLPVSSTPRSLPPWLLPLASRWGLGPQGSHVGTWSPSSSQVLFLRKCWTWGMEDEEVLHERLTCYVWTVTSPIYVLLKGHSCDTIFNYL